MVYEDILSNRFSGVLSAKLIWNKRKREGSGRSASPNNQTSANMIENEDTINVNLSGENSEEIKNSLISNRKS